MRYGSEAFSLCTEIRMVGVQVSVVKFITWLAHQVVVLLNNWIA
jgi:hypothetical protein